MVTEQPQPTPMSRLQKVDKVPYPAPPWDMKGQMWMGLFKTDTPIQLPGGLKHLLDPRSLLVTLVRYLEGALCYDELAFCAVTRLGSQIGVYTDYIWVTDLAALWGGRRIWGVPKNMAEFTWQDSTVRVTDQQGLIVTIKVDMTPAGLPWMWTKTPTIGQLENGAFVHTVGDLWARFGKANMQIKEWSTPCSYSPGNKPGFSVGLKPFRVHLPAARVISH